MNKKNIEKELENMKSIKLTDSEKHILWSKVEGGIRARRTYGKKPATLLGMSSRFVVAVVLVVFVLTSGSIATVSAANAAVPGDRLFPLDEALERIELFFTRQENRAERRLKFAQERLYEARIIVALAETNGDDTSTSTDATATDDTATSTDDTSTSTDDASTSTDDTSTSTDDTNGGDEGQRSRRIARAEHVLNIALVRLEAMRDGFLAEGNDEAVAAIDEIITELTELAEAHIAFLELIDADIKGVRDDIRELRDEIRESRDELRFRFDYRVENNEDDDDDDEDDDDRDKNRSRSEFRFRFDKFFGDFDGDDGKHGYKTLLCHIPPGNSGNAHTISVGSPAAARAHISHGDTEGRCGDIGGDDDDEDEDGDEDEDEDEDEEEAKLTVIKVVVNDDGGSSDVDDFTLLVGDEEVESGEDNEFELGDYTVSEEGPDGYEATFSGDCDENGNVILEKDDDKICTITNDDVESDNGDVTPPVISGLSVVTGTSTADIDWDTDEDADSKYWQSTSTPVDTSGTPSAETSDLVTSHSLELSGLTASTTYFYVISSTDEAGNTMTTTESSFTTLSE